MTGSFTATDYVGWLMAGTLLAAMWAIAAMVIIDPPILLLRFVAPLLATTITCGIILIGLDAT